MIKYPEGPFGFQILFRLHGSAVFKSLMPALLSSAIYIALYRLLDLEEDGKELLDHPYPIGALVSAFTFLLSFRANFAYNRYWEAYTAVHQMHSKWLDVGMDLAAFHLQSARYDSIKPPAFGQHPHLTSIERERERINEPTREEIEHQIDDCMEKEKEIEKQFLTSRISKWKLLRRRRKHTNEDATATTTSRSAAAATTTTRAASAVVNTHNYNTKNQKARLKDKNDKRALDQRIQQTKKNINATPNAVPPKKPPRKSNNKTHRRIVSAVTASTDHRLHLDEDALDERPLFLQEVAHLLSLLSAVALSTLRNDLEYAESPLITFTPGAPFPCVDPDGITADLREDWAPPPPFPFVTTLRFLFGLSRNEAGRALYNAERPFRVIGGVSDNEVLLLQAARGPQAKVNLVSMWVQEFISREFLAGSCGKVDPPIISRLYQFMSDGNLGYNQARKVAYIPFPFVHAQITCLFVIIIMAIIPVLMLTYLTNELFGFILNLLTVMCFAGLHEVSRELENPFQNAPNDLPANHFQGQYNEALMTMFSGYHPDAYWEVKETVIPEDTTTQLSPLESIDLGSLVAGLHRDDGLETKMNDQHYGSKEDAMDVSDVYC